MQGAFVIQLRREPDPERGCFEGRIEHVDSGCSTHFQDLHEFLLFVTSCFAVQTDSTAPDSSRTTYPDLTGNL